MVACFILSRAQMRLLCQTPGRRRPLITGRFGNAAVRGPALDAISIRAALVVCVPLLLCAGWRQHTNCAVPSLLLKTGNNTPYPCLASEARAPVCPTWLTEKLRPLCHALEAISIPSFAAVCWQPMDCSHLVFASNIPFRLF